MTGLFWNWYLHCNIIGRERKIRTSFKTLVSKKAATWCLKKISMNFCKR